MEALAPASSASNPPAPPAPAVRQIYLNQVGYLPGREKIATVILPAEQTGASTEASSDGTRTFHVRSTQGSAIVFTGTLSAPRLDPASGDHVCGADLSPLSTSGSYRVEVSGVLGDPFPISPTAYAEALRLTMRSFYGQRCGTKVDLGHGYKHGKCHPKGQFSASSGKSGPVGNHGGWHDAGDYGRYVVNSAFSCATLLWAWELFPDALQKLALDIPESGKALPDFLAEVKWNLDWLLAMQDLTDGGVWHKQTSLHFCAFIMPEKDRLPSEIIGTGVEPYKNTTATADFAATMALAARCYRPFNAPYADRCLAAARRAFAWCEAHPEIPFKNPPTVATGEYGDAHCADEILWAAAELFRTTQEPAFETAALDRITPLLATLRIETPSWNNVASVGLWTYALATAGKPGPATTAIRTATQAAAAALTEQHRQNGYGNTLREGDFHWGSNSNAGNGSLLLLVANHFEPNPAATEAALSNLHYLLGRNCFGISWVTHLGVRPFLHPHHRPSAADGIAAPWPGLLSGGPNAHGGDAVADHLPQSPPMRMWVDDERAYSLNEVAINWNAPLVFLLAYANSKQASGSAT